MPRIRASREAVFVCTYTTRSGDESLWVRAWSEDQARELAAAQLAEAGVATRGALHIVPIHAVIATGEGRPA